MALPARPDRANEGVDSTHIRTDGLGRAPSNIEETDMRMTPLFLAVGFAACASAPTTSANRAPAPPAKPGAAAPATPATRPSTGAQAPQPPQEPQGERPAGAGEPPAGRTPPVADLGLTTSP
jgi:hypothetical protein